MPLAYSAGHLTTPNIPHSMSGSFNFEWALQVGRQLASFSPRRWCDHHLDRGRGFPVRYIVIPGALGNQSSRMSEVLVPPFRYQGCHWSIQMPGGQREGVWNATSGVSFNARDPPCFVFPHSPLSANRIDTDYHDRSR